MYLYSIRRRQGNHRIIELKSKDKIIKSIDIFNLGLPDLEHALQEATDQLIILAQLLGATKKQILILI